MLIAYSFSVKITTVFPHIVSAETIFFIVEIQRSQYIRPKVTVHKCAESIQGRKLFKGGNYMRKYGNPVTVPESLFTNHLRFSIEIFPLRPA